MLLLQIECTVWVLCLHARHLRQQRSVIPCRWATYPGGTDCPEWDESPCRHAGQTWGSGPSILQCHGWCRRSPSATAHHLVTKSSCCNERQLWRTDFKPLQDLFMQHGIKLKPMTAYKVTSSIFKLRHRRSWSDCRSSTWISYVMRHHVFGLDGGIPPTHQMESLCWVLVNHTAGWEEIPAVNPGPGTALLIKCISFNNW